MISLSVYVRYYGMYLIYTRINVNVMIRINWESDIEKEIYNQNHLLNKNLGPPIIGKISTSHVRYL